MIGNVGIGGNAAEIMGDLLAEFAERIDAVSKVEHKDDDAQEQEAFMQTFLDVLKKHGISPDKVQEIGADKPGDVDD